MHSIALFARCPDICLFQVEQITDPINDLVQVNSAYVQRIFARQLFLVRGKHLGHKIPVSENSFIRLLPDFGCTHRFEAFPPSDAAHQTTTGQIIGTPSYMSPEQIRGEPLGPASEIFSLGSVLYEMVTGAKPFTGPTDVAVTHAIIHKKPVRIRKLSPKTPRQLVRVIMKCLRKKSSRRYATMDELARLFLSVIKTGGPS